MNGARSQRIAALRRTQARMQDAALGRAMRRLDDLARAADRVAEHARTPLRIVDGADIRAAGIFQARLSQARSCLALEMERQTRAVERERAMSLRQHRIADKLQERAAQLLRNESAQRDQRDAEGRGSGRVSAEP